jgi:GNAT superfamily N-acetyltransferase
VPVRHVPTSGIHDTPVANAPGSTCQPRSDKARYCLGEYYTELARRFENGFDVSLSRDPEVDDMIRPRGAFLVAMSDGLPIGCVGLRGTGSEIAEIKRLWVAPSARGLGVGRRLMGATENAARQLSIKTLRLDTNRARKRLYNFTAAPRARFGQQFVWIELGFFAVRRGVERPRRSRRRAATRAVIESCYGVVHTRWCAELANEDIRKNMDCH